MPHKHRRSAHDASAFELPPKTFANPLPVGKPILGKRKRSEVAHSSTRKSKSPQDDTPKAFLRLMQYNQARFTTARGPKNQGKTVSDGSGATTSARPRSLPVRGGNQPSLTSSATNDVPQIQPGEKLSEFRARVDAEMPLSGISTGGKKLRFGKLREEPLTKHAKKLRKLQAAWRKEEARRKEKLEGEVEEMEENEELGGGMQKGISSSKRRGRTVEDDPWAQLAQARGRVSAGLHDVVQAPPKFDDVRRVRNGAAVMIANTPKGAGSLSKREDIGEERLELIKRYREMMKRHRNNGL